MTSAIVQANMMFNSLSYFLYASPCVTQVFEDVQRFLGVDSAPLKTKLEKIHTKTIQETIDNFEGIAMELAGTPSAWMLFKEKP